MPMLHWDHFIVVTKQAALLSTKMSIRYSSKRKPICHPEYRIYTNKRVIKDAAFDYMRTKNGNIIAAVDKKKSLTQQFKQYQKSEFRSSLKEKTKLSLRKV
jgi:ABC-type branched-subunit amino acid transport system substrate-binding protein